MIKKLLLPLLFISFFVEAAVENVNQNELKDILKKSDKPVVIDFYADWCQPCKLMAPVFDSISNELKDTYRFLKMNYDENKDLAEEYKIKSIPTFIVIKENKLVGQISGYMKGEQLKEKIDEALNGPKPLNNLSPEKLHARLGESLMRGDAEEVKRIVIAGVDLDKKFENGQTPLLLAVTLGPQLFGEKAQEIVTLLLDAGASMQVSIEVPGNLPTRMNVMDVLSQTVVNLKRICVQYEDLEKYLQDYTSPKNQEAQKEDC